jgi:hypothetical protein
MVRPHNEFKSESDGIDSNSNSINNTTSSQETISTKKKENLARGRDDKFDPNHTLAGLNCTAFGGPSEDIAQEMVYWSDIPSDSKFVSPFFQRKSGDDDKAHVQYMTFEPDGGI